MQCESKYSEIYDHDPDNISFCGYRISPLGAHTDHQGGHVLGCAIDKGIHIAYGRKESGICEIRSIQFPNRAQFHVNNIPKERCNDWADHCRGAVKILSDRYDIRYGISCVIEGELPIGGLSSSAAVIICFMRALASVNNIRLSDWELIEFAKKAENEYVGVRCGKLDQACEVLSKEGSLLYLDCLDNSYRYIASTKTINPYSFIIFFSGLERSLINSSYNLRQDECKAAAYSLLAFSGMSYKKFQDTVLRDVPIEAFECYKDNLPDAFKHRAIHFFEEEQRVRAGVDMWLDGDIEAFGSLMSESGSSSIFNYQCGSPEMIELYNILISTSGVYGARFSGAGSRGSCIALVDTNKQEEIQHEVKEKYLRQYPKLADRYMSSKCNLSDGVGGL